MLLALVAVYLAVLTLWPLGRLLVEALGPGRDGAPLGLLIDQWSSRSTERALTNTLSAGLLSALLSAVIGTAMAFAVRLTDIRGKTAMVFVLMLPILIPPQITALAWIDLVGPSSPILAPLGLAAPYGATNPLYSFGGIVFVMGIENSTLVFLAVRAALAALPRDVVEAARVVGARPVTIVLRIVLPLTLSSILAGLILAFVSAIGNFGVPALLGIPGRVTVLTTLIYQRLNGFGPSVLGEVGALALILVLLAVAALVVRARLAARHAVAIDRSGAGLEPFRLGRARRPAELAVWALLGTISLLPLAALLATSLTPAVGVPLGWDTATLDNYRFALVGNDATRRAFLNSFLLASATAIVCAGLAVPLAYLSVMRRRRFARALDLVADTPYAIPGMALSIGVIMAFLPPLPLLGVSLYNTLWILLAAYLARFLTLALRPVVSGLETIEPALDEAARIVGAGTVRRLWSIVLPAAAPFAGAGALLIFMTAFNELTVSALLWSTGHETLGVVVFFLNYEGNATAAAALAVVTVAVTLALAGLVSMSARRLPAGTVPWRA
ncbi:iron ABC transporter permease [Aurantimonas sp. MSK8Z-1]|uniref:ABC transporter permease n=1 Tax=Mangrovibrevibacter kandeliae TaxID=2968473 RepID=UPI002118B19B|nr:iron ABC transporter permease [Aurantimonas sp. MSK8Z-1]MCW4115692.1 iron ABC transporter permease [Aurantimonas sp. MSK8Z-1]